MIRLLGFILIFVIFTCFIVLNLQHRSNLSFGFVEFNDVPVFVSVLFSFMLGMLFAIPLAFSLAWKKRGTNKPPNKKAEKSSQAEQTAPDQIKKEISLYGID